MECDYCIARNVFEMKNKILQIHSENSACNAVARLQRQFSQKLLDDSIYGMPQMRELCEQLQTSHRRVIEESSARNHGSRAFGIQSINDRKNLVRCTAYQADVHSVHATIFFSDNFIWKSWSPCNYLLELTRNIHRRHTETCCAIVYVYVSFAGETTCARDHNLLFIAARHAAHRPSQATNT